MARRCGIPTAAGSSAWRRIRASCPGRRCQNDRARRVWLVDIAVWDRRTSVESKRVGCEQNAVGSLAGCGFMRRDRARWLRSRPWPGSGWQLRAVQSSKAEIRTAFGTWYAGWSRPPSETPGPHRIVLGVVAGVEGGPCKDPPETRAAGGSGAVDPPPPANAGTRTAGAADLDSTGHLLRLRLRTHDGEVGGVLSNSARALGIPCIVADPHPSLASAVSRLTRSTTLRHAPRQT